MDQVPASTKEYFIPRILHSSPIAILVVAVLYAVLAQTGYQFASLPGHISPIFPSAGIALAAVLILGRSALFGIWLGSFAANTISFFYGSIPPTHTGGTDFLIGSVIGLGAMASADIGALLSRRFFGNRYPLQSAANVLAFVTIVALGSCVISSIIGVLCLSLAGEIPWKAFGYSWLTWWIGDTAGVVIITPLVLSWHHGHPLRWGPWRTLEAVGLGGATLLACVTVFFHNAPFEYGLLLLLLWAAFHFGMRGASAVATAIAICATIATSHGYGPFATVEANESLLHLDLFMGVIVICALFPAGMLAERKRGEEALQQSQQLLRSTFASLRDAFFVLDAQTGLITDCNRAASEMFGYEVHEMVGRTTQFLHINEAALAEFRQHLFTAIEARGFLFLPEFAMKRKDGTVFPTEHSVTAIELEGRRVGWASAVRDITERKQAEEEKRGLQTQLIQAQKLDVLGQLAGGVAHDFNNILAATMMNLGLLQTDPNLNQETREGLRELEAEATRAAGLTRQLLMFSRRAVLETRVLDLNELVANLRKMLGRVLGEPIALVFEPSDSVLGVEADAGMLEQVLMNLTVNARDAMPKGGRITLRAEAVEIDAERAAANAQRRLGRFACLSVSDTGCGIDAATLGRIFEPFFTTKEPGKGTGLGLATVHGIVVQHHGWVEVESLVGHGTTFRVFLPASTHSPTETGHGGPQVVPAGQETLLVVEDDASVRKMLVQTLRVLGYQVLEAANGQAAMVLWQQHGPQISLLLTDMVMPEGMTGLELAKRIRAEKSDLKVIISSGYNAEITEPGKIPAAGIVYLPKPYQAPLLGKLVRECLDEK